MIAFASHTNGRDARANRMIEGSKKSLKKRLTERGDALRCTPRNGERKSISLRMLKKSKDSIDVLKKIGNLFSPARRMESGGNAGLKKIERFH